MYETEVPQLEVTSKVNVSGANEKGTIELDWSGYDIQNKYFVIYRKETNSAEWEKIISLEQKFNGNKYTDNLANDKNLPTKPNINIEGNMKNNTLEIIATATDIGNKYIYYIEAYDNTNTLINISNET